MATEKIPKQRRGRPRHQPNIVIEVTTEPDHFPINYNRLREAFIKVASHYKGDQEKNNPPAQEEEQIEFWAS